MTSRPHTFWKRKGLAIAGCLVVAAGVGFVIHQGKKSTVSPVAPSTTETYPVPDLQDPALSFDTLRYTADTGGNGNTRDRSIVWLDQQTRSLQPLSPSQEEWMFGMLRGGGHPEWDKDFKFWVFNSAFNVLHLGPRQQDLTRLLAKLAVHDPDKTMRLYALQHLEVQRTNGRLTGALADEVRAIFLQIATTPDSQEAGLALRFLADWDQAGSSLDADLAEQALKLASNPSLSVDIRISSLHAAGLAALDLARLMAADATQPTLVRKASIALIGAHGGESDISALQALSAENVRLRQAAEPATQAIRQRISNPNSHPTLKLLN